MRIGLLGGTFDPIHLGHMRAAEVAREELRLDEVWLIPAGRPPHRREPTASAAQRFEMAALAAAERPGFRASDLELRRPGPSYTVDTLEQIRSAAPGDTLVLIVGSDAYADTPNWKAPERLFAMCEIAVLRRPGAGVSASGASYVDGVFLAVSSTEIRGLLKSGKGARYLVPGPVLNYIHERGLYS